MGVASGVVWSLLRGCLKAVWVLFGNRLGMVLGVRLLFPNGASPQGEQSVFLGSSLMQVDLETIILRTIVSRSIMAPSI